jgi:hypothetical protein
VPGTAIDELLEVAGSGSVDEADRIGEIAVDTSRLVDSKGVRS